MFVELLIVLEIVVQKTFLTLLLIQVYMGDRKGKGTPLSSAQEIIIKGWHCVPLRDEIYMQLCKQTTDNPKL